MHTRFSKCGVRGGVICTSPFCVWNLLFLPDKDLVELRLSQQMPSPWVIVWFRSTRLVLIRRTREGFSSSINFIERPRRNATVAPPGSSRYRKRRRKKLLGWQPALDGRILRYVLLTTTGILITQCNKKPAWKKKGNNAAGRHTSLRRVLAGKVENVHLLRRRPLNFQSKICYPAGSVQGAAVIQQDQSRSNCDHIS